MHPYVLTSPCRLRMWTVRTHIYRGLCDHHLILHPPQRCKEDCSLSSNSLSDLKWLDPDPELVTDEGTGKLGALTCSSAPFCLLYFTKPQKTISKLCSPRRLPQQPLPGNTRGLHSSASSWALTAPYISPMGRYPWHTVGSALCRNRNNPHTHLHRNWGSTPQDPPRPLSTSNWPHERQKNTTYWGPEPGGLGLWILDQSLISCVILGNLFNLSVLTFIISKMG